ncbi:DUF1735 domain-containing protein [Pedobacter sp.]|uniref:DUF1735 domain-containing protein n=1 Tax=Pedobacter sp. TaxID=1411316 RepID=UPI003D7F43EB
MKKTKLAALMGIFMVLAACSKEVDVNLDVPGAASFKKLYMPQAAYNPVASAVSIVDKDTSFTYSAFLGGTSAASREITVHFSVLPEKVAAYNKQNGTNYSIMPAGSYTLEATTSTIPKGKQTTGKHLLSIKSIGFINPFETYLLPVTVTREGEDVLLNEDLATTYYLFTGSYAQGEVPREKVYSFGRNAGKLFTHYYSGDIVRTDPVNGNLLRYPMQENGTYGAPKLIGSGFNIFNLIMHFGGDRIIGRRTDNGNLLSFNFDRNDNVSNTREIGQGWNVFTKVIPFKASLLGINAAGAMTLYPLNAGGGFGGAKAAGTGWDAFVQILPYQNSLLAIESNGTMWQYPFSDDGVAGARIKVGTGWNMYDLVITSGTDLLGLDSNGDLWRYKFNPLGLWPL